MAPVVLSPARGAMSGDPVGKHESTGMTFLGGSPK